MHEAKEIDVTTKQETTNLIDLYNQSREQRGLWIGLAADPAWSRGLKAIDDPHCTLIHFGKLPRTLHEVAMIAGIAGRLSRLGVVDAYVMGAARFTARSESDGDPVVLLLEGKRLRDMRRHCCELVEAARLSAYTDPLDWIPHLTIGRHPADAELHMRRHPREAIKLGAVTVTCGDARLSLPLSLYEGGPVPMPAPGVAPT